ncbi:MAG: DNA cytosine methyltransferase [Xenococcaceae cyanobacterium]
MANQELKFVDLFAGIGGFRIAFEKAGYACVDSCEINEACQKVYFNNFGELPKPDITTINIEKVLDFDVLTAGFPCQPFSICGRRKGFQDTRGTLFFNICEIIKAKNPNVVVLENVKHLIHHDKGRTLDVILYSLEDLGYLVDRKLLNGKDFGVPQNRERIIIIAAKNKKFNFDFIQTIAPVPKLRYFLEEHFNFNYKTHGASKLPVLAFYAIYQCLIVEVERYKSCTLKELGSHTASDRTSKSSGDLEIFYKNKNLIEALEIKLGKKIDLQMMLNVKDKIIKFNPRRSYIFSSVDVKKNDSYKINNEIQEIAKNHGCQVITNGIIPTFKYYLR